MAGRVRKRDTDPAIWRARRLVARAKRVVASNAVGRDALMLASDLRSAIEDLRVTASDVNDELQALVKRVNAAGVYKLSAQRARTKADGRY